MKNLLYQFYNEGFGSTFYKKPAKFIDKHIKNKFLNDLLKSLLIVLYTISVLLFAGYIFYRKIK
jgi:hypothetical protein